MVIAGGVPRVVLVDPQPLFRAGLARLLAERPDLRVVGQAAAGIEALRLVARARPDVVVVEPGPETELIGQLARRHPPARILVLTASAGDGELIAALRAGASGYLLKNSDARAVACAIHAVMGGKSVLSDAVGERLVGLLTGQPAPGQRYDGLTAREVEVLKLVAGGTGYKQVARLLRISHQTVRTHVCHIYEKLAVGDRSQMIRYALRKGLVEL